MAKGWHRESRRHSLARRGVKTAVDDKPINRVPERTKDFEFPNDLLQAEFSNITNDTSNPWKWKKGEEMNRWTDNTDWIIVKVNKYPDSGVTLKRKR